jgi:hypothetical protein
MVLSNYKKSLVTLFAKLNAIHSRPKKKFSECLVLQESLIDRIIYVEKRIRSLKFSSKECRRELSRTEPVRLCKNESIVIKQRVEYVESLIKDYKLVSYIFRSIGDGIAFTYLNKYDIKPLSFKESAGFISGKEGLWLEKKLLRLAFQVGGIAILNDITNCLRYGDVTLINKGIPTLIEAKIRIRGDAREERQHAKGQKILDYLRTKEAKDLVIPGYLVKRIGMHAKERHHRPKLNRLIRNALRLGHSFSRVEDGLFYLVTTELDVALIKTIIERCKMPPYYYFINMFKQGGPEYFPFTLSIQDPEALFAFYNGQLFIFVFIDPDVVFKSLLAQGLQGEFQEDEQYWLKLNHVEKEKAKFSPLFISRHLFLRVPLEFLSLEWMLNEIGFKAHLFPEIGGERTSV